MYAAIQILEKAYSESGAMQTSPEAASYRSQIELSIKVLKAYQSKMDKVIERELSIVAKYDSVDNISNLI